jgi:hypothetical protein
VVELEQYVPMVVRGEAAIITIITVPGFGTLES